MLLMYILTEWLVTEVVLMCMAAIYKIVSRKLVSDRADGDSSVPSYNSQKVTLPSSSAVTDKGTKTSCC